MLCLVGVSSKEYIESSSRAVHRGLELSCPDPDCADARLVGHGGYRRYLGGELQKIARVCCRRCGVTHGVFAGRCLRVPRFDAGLPGVGVGCRGSAVGGPSAGATRGVQPSVASPGAAEGGGCGHGPAKPPASVASWWAQGAACGVRAEPWRAASRPRVAVVGVRLLVQRIVRIVAPRTTAASGPPPINKPW